MEVKDNPQNRKKCICPDCPSYPHECKGEILYCSSQAGHSRCDIHASGCVCQNCPVYSQFKLAGLYFCDKAVPSGMRKKASHESEDFYRSLSDIKEIAASGKSIVRSMGSLKILPFSLDDLHFIPGQVSRIPLNKEEPANTSIIIGPVAKRPLRISSPILVSGLSYGAVSKNVRLVISQACSNLGMAFNSGEGGILPEELPHARFMIAQYATGRFGITEELLKKPAAMEIRFGQGAYPGKGSFLPAEKMSPEVSRVRGLEEGEPAYSPARHKDMLTPEQISQKISYLKKLTGGVPIGAKIGCGNVEKDIQILSQAGADFIALDGFGGGTGATDAYVRDNVGLPIYAALPRAHEHLQKLGLRKKITLIAGGSLRTSADFAKCLALGADAVYTGTAALIAINCEQYRICHTGLCPTGVTTHNPALTGHLEVKEGVRKLSNWLRACTEEIATFARICGKDDIRKLDKEDLVALKKEMAELTGVKWINGEYSQKP